MSSTATTATIVVKYTPGHVYRVLNEIAKVDDKYYVDFIGPTFNRLIAKELTLEAFEMQRKFEWNKNVRDLEFVYPSYVADDSKPAEKVDYLMDKHRYYSSVDGMVLLLSTIVRKGHGVVSGDQFGQPGREFTVTFNDAETRDCYDWLATRVTKIKRAYRYNGELAGLGLDGKSGYNTVSFSNATSINSSTVSHLVREVSNLEHAFLMSIYYDLGHEDGFGYEDTDIIKNNFCMLEAFRDHPLLDITIDIAYMTQSVEDVMVADYCWNGKNNPTMPEEDELDEGLAIQNPLYTRDEATVNEWKDALRYFFNGYSFDEKIDTINTAPLTRLWPRIRLFTFAKPLDSADSKDIRYSLDRSFVKKFNVENAPWARYMMLKMLYGQGSTRSPIRHLIRTTSPRIERATFDIINEALTHAEPNKVMPISPLLAFAKPE